MHAILAAGRSGNVVLEVIFWILLILAVVGGWFIPDASPYAHRGRWTFALILIGILGFVVFGSPA